MRPLLLVLAPAVLAACAPAAAAAPDSTDPAHCIAAFNYAAFWLKQNERAGPERVTDMVARAIYELDKIKAAGGSVADAHERGRALTVRYAADPKAMDALFLACGRAQDGDPRFRERRPALIEAARAAQARSGY
jgi:hypothetical protein